MNLNVNADISKGLIPAVSVELLHLFSLIHDDIMDKDKLRHGKETVNVKWDNDIALLAGDAMLALALQKLNSYSENQLLFPTFVDGLLAVCEGQALDKEFEEKKNIDISEYINMIDLKTGYLIGLSAELGAIISNASNNKIILLRDFGRKIGVIWDTRGAPLSTMLRSCYHFFAVPRTPRTPLETHLKKTSQKSGLRESPEP